jgi:hypothetical protein
MDMILRKSKANKVRYLNGFLCCALSFFLTMACVVLSVLAILDTSVLPGTIRQVLVSSGYYENLQKDLYRRAEEMTVPTGLSPDVLEGIFLREEIIREVDEYIDASANGKSHQPAAGEVEARLGSRIKSFLTQRGIQPDTEQQRSIEEYIASISKEYRSNVRFPLISYLGTFTRNYQMLGVVCRLLCVGFLVLNLALLKRINQKRIHFMQYMYYSITAWAWMLLFLPGILLLIKPYNAIQLHPRYINEFILQYITVLLRKLLSAGMAALLFSFLILLYGRGKESYDKDPSPGRLQES